MSLYNGILHLTNWAGNVIMPTLGALFIVIAIMQFARGQHQVYSIWAYGGILCLLVSGLLRAMEKFTGQLGWNNPDLYWNAILNLVGASAPSGNDVIHGCLVWNDRIA